MKKYLLSSIFAIFLATGAVQNAQAQTAEYDVYLLNSGGQNDHFYKNGIKTQITTHNGLYIKVVDMQVVGNDLYVLYENRESLPATFFLWKNGTASQISGDAVYYLGTETGFTSQVTGMCIDLNGDIYYSGYEHDGSYSGAKILKYWKNNVPFPCMVDAIHYVEIGGTSDIFVENGFVTIPFTVHSNYGYAGQAYWHNGSLVCFYIDDSREGYKLPMYGGEIYGLYNAPYYVTSKHWGYWKNNTIPIIFGVGNEEYPNGKTRGIFIDNTGVYTAGILYDADNKCIPVYWKGTGITFLPIPDDAVNPSVKMSNVMATDIYVIDGKVFILGSGRDSEYNSHSILWADGVPSIIEGFYPPSYHEARLEVAPRNPAAIAAVQADKLQIIIENGELKIENYAGGAVQIFDVMGRAVGARLIAPLQNGVQTINISGLPAGIYIVRAGNQSAKFVKQ